MKFDFQQILNLVTSYLLKRFQARTLVLRQFFLFSLVGVFNTAIDWLIYYLLTRGFGIYYLLANIFSFVVSATSAYLINSRWTFKQAKFSIQHLYRYLIVSAFTLAIVQLALYLMVDHLKIWDLFAKVLVLILSVLSNFFWNKHWTFKS